MSDQVVLLSVSEAAKRGRLAEEHVHQAIRERSVTCLVVDDQWMVDQDTLDHWAEQYRDALSDAAPMPGPCPHWCELDPGHAWDSFAHQRWHRVHRGPTFGEDGATTHAMEFADAGGYLERIRIEPPGDYELTSTEASERAAWLQEAASWARQIEDEQAWWRTSLNPSCASWCEREHEAGEFALAGALTCCRAVRFSRGELIVTRVAMADERIGAEVGALELAPATVSVELDPARADVDGEYAEASFNDLASGLTAALAEAQTMLLQAGQPVGELVP